jgi:hypothetical protein
MEKQTGMGRRGLVDINMWERGGRQMEKIEETDK